MSKKKIGIIRFLGTNCDRDIEQALRDVGRVSEYLWFKNRYRASDYDAFVIPGGFSYGDYLRTGALSARAPVMDTVREAAEAGTPILGICNGFQILCEAGLLPGVLMRNQGLKFKDEWVQITLGSAQSPWISGYQAESVLKVPIAHGEGRYYADPETLERLQDKEQILCTYRLNPNGSVCDIAGITNQNKNVAGLMPHPERALYKWMGSDDGRRFFEWLA
jgi:phosphoribosylformylglycinamidine synthase